MKFRDKFLTSVLLVLIGILIGTLISLYQRGSFQDNHAKVNITDIKRNSEPLIADSVLEKMDSRFLLKSVAHQVKPSVVYIETVIPIDRSELENDKYHDFDDSIWDKFFPKHQARTVGSGVIISSDGYILTNNHVVEDAVDDGIRVILNDKRSYKARLIGNDPSTDLAVIKVNDHQLPAITMGNSDKVNVGEWVLAIGNPFRLRFTVTAGIVSALNRDVQIINERLKVESFIQTDAAINKGNSGGALVNTDGDLIGINTAIASQTGNYQGYGFAVPVNLAVKVAHDLIEYGEVHRAFLGISMASVDFDRARELGMEGVHGVEILNVVGKSAAEEYGLQAHDVILSINGEPVDEANELQEKVAVRQPGDMISLTVWRDQKEKQFNVQLKSANETEAFAANRREQIEPEQPRSDNNESGTGVNFGEFDVGIRVMAIAKPEDLHRYDLIITNVTKHSEAWNRGLKEGFQILKVNDQKVEDLKTLKDLMDRGFKKRGSVMLLIQKDEQTTGYFELKRK